MDLQKDNVQAEQYKADGNSYFKIADYEKSIECYTMAIERSLE